MKRPPEGPLHSPSRFRFRPPSPLTFGFRLRPSSGASTYLRPVLGAIGRLGGVGSRCKVANGEQFALCELFFFQHVPSNLSNLWKSSPVPAMFSTDSSGAGLSLLRSGRSRRGPALDVSTMFAAGSGNSASSAESPQWCEQGIGDALDDPGEG